MGGGGGGLASSAEHHQEGRPASSLQNLKMGTEQSTVVVGGVCVGEGGGYVFAAASNSWADLIAWTCEYGQRVLCGRHSLVVV